MKKQASDKLSDAFREELRSLGKGRTIQFIVTLQYPAYSGATRALGQTRRARRKETTKAFSEQMEMTLSQWIRPVLREHGGELIHVYPELGTIAVQGCRPLVEQLSDVPVVTSIMDNQTVHAIDAPR